jgi:hypothetical protein
LKDQTAASLIGAGNITNKINVFRFTQSLDDSTLLFWRPYRIKGGEWPFILLFKLAEGRLLPNYDLGASVQKIDRAKVSVFITTLEIANNSFLNAHVYGGG